MPMPATTLASAGPIVDAHEQKFLNSCSTSLAEMMLKLGGKVDPLYYELQKLDTPQGSGLALIRDRTIAGVTFRVISPSLGAAGILQKIREELAAGRSVGVYLPGADGAAHGWLAAEIETDQIIFLSKYSERGGGEGKESEELVLKFDDLEVLTRVDCIYYEETPTL
jgi:hypothetical protein